MLDLPLDHRHAGLVIAGVGRVAEEVDGVADRGQRVAQLVREQGEELGLAAVGLAEGVLHPLPLGQVDEEGEDRRLAPVLLQQGGARRGRGRARPSLRR